jgi:hypothetical protein
MTTHETSNATNDYSLEPVTNTLGHYTDIYIYNTQHTYTKSDRRKVRKHRHVRSTIGSFLLPSALV